MIVAILVLLAFAVGANLLVGAADAVSVLDAVRQRDLLAKPLGLAAIPLLVTVSLVAMFYCLDALHGERRDRSILFWKSLPVSDLVTVGSKALIPLVVLPVVACLAFIVMQVGILLIGSGVLVAHGMDGTVLWQAGPVLRTWGALIHGIVVLTLWHAPVYAWLLLVSGWAKRSTFLWAIFPPFAVCLVEKLALDTTFVWSLLKDRLFGMLDWRLLMPWDANASDALARPSLWIGLVVAVLLLATTVWMRRYRQPV